MTDEPIPSVAEVRPGPPTQGVATQGVNRYSGPEYTSVPKPWLDEQLAEIRRLRERILEIEAIITVGHGTMGTLEQPDAPATITHGHAPSAPPHDE